MKKTTVEIIGKQRTDGQSIRLFRDTEPVIARYKLFIFGRRQTKKYLHMWINYENITKPELYQGRNKRFMVLN